MTRRHVALTGSMGSGKTTIGRLLALRLALPFDDSDDSITRDIGADPPTIATVSGVDTLHELEAQHALDALDGPPSIVGIAASAIEVAEVRSTLTRCAFTVWLDSPIDALIARVAAGSGRRPLDVDAFRALHGRRRRLYERTADLRVQDAGLSADQIADLVALAVGEVS